MNTLHRLVSYNEWLNLQPFQQGFIAHQQGSRYGSEFDESECPHLN